MHNDRVTWRHYAVATGGFAVAQALMLVLVAATSAKPLWRHLFTLDALWYASIVDGGYSYPATPPSKRSNLAFFPFLPALGWLFKAVTGNTGAALEIAGVLGSLAAIAGIVTVIAHVSSPRVGVATALLWSIAPRSHVLVMPYTEGWFTAACAWVLYGVLTRRWWLAAVAAAVAGVTRPSALVLVAALVLGAAVTWWLHRRDGVDRRQVFAAGAGALVGLLSYGGYWLYVAARGNGFGTYTRIQKSWGTYLGTPGVIWRDFVKNVIQVPPWGMRAGLLIFLGLVIYALLIAWMIKRRDDVWLTVFAVGMFGLAIVSSGYYFVKLRFLLPAFPVWLPLAAFLSGLRWWWQVAAGVLLTSLWLWWTVDFVLNSSYSP